MTVVSCVSILNKKGVVGLPTDTVYGLAADATSDQAVCEIYALKNRPAFNPLIVHVDTLEKAQSYGQFNEDALKLARHFWPPSKYAAPLTIVVPVINKRTPLSKLALAGLDTVALRVPNHPLALQVLKEFAGPLAAPSANPSNYLSPTTAQHVQQAFPHICVLDGGPCSVGIESTIVGCIDNQVYLLRTGVITQEDIEFFLGKPITIKAHDAAINAPGQLKKHYAPKTPLYKDVIEPQPGDIYIGFGQMRQSVDFNLSLVGDLKEAAANLFKYLHDADLKQGKRIAVAPIPNQGIGIAINEKLTKAKYWPNQ